MNLKHYHSPKLLYLTLLLTIFGIQGSYCQDSITESKTWKEAEIASCIVAVDVLPGTKELHMLDPLGHSQGTVRVRQLTYGRPFYCKTFDRIVRLGIEDGINEIGAVKYKTVASAHIPDSISEAVLILIPDNIVTGRTEGEVSYQIRIMDGSTHAFPLSHTQVINLLPTKIVLKIGEEKQVVPSGGTVKIDKISDLDAYNMADVSFFYHAKDQWNILKQSKIRYLPSIRYTAIAYFNMRVKKPTIVFIRDGGHIHRRLPASSPAPK